MSKYRIVKVGLYYQVQSWAVDERLTYLANYLVRSNTKEFKNIYGWKPVDANKFVTSLTNLGIPAPEGMQLCCKYDVLTKIGSEDFNYHQTMNSANKLVALLKEYKDDGIYTDIRQFLPYREDVISAPHLMETRNYAV